MLAHKMEVMENDGDDDEEEEEENVRTNVNLSEANFKNKLLEGFWLCNDKDVDLRLARLEHLMNRRPKLVNSVVLRQNPHNVEQWHRRVKIFEGKWATLRGCEDS
jgi:pre-mRNA-splicing factor SYF1